MLITYSSNNLANYYINLAAVAECRKGRYACVEVGRVGQAELQGLRVPFCKLKFSKE